MLFRSVRFEYSAFAVDGRSDLSMIVYNPVDPEVKEKIRGLMEASPAHEHA